MSAHQIDQRFRIRLLQAAGLGASVFLIAGQPIWSGGVHEALEFTGFCLIILCLMGRLWSILYVGSKKNRDLVMDGPYSITRNPLYIFSTIGAVGVGLVYGSIVAAILLGGLVCVALTFTARKEAAFLRDRFESAYEAYAKRTPLFWPQFSLYRDAAEVAFSPHALRRTFLDGLFFVAMFPALELLEMMQANGIVTVLYHLV
jgi:protein-S-isoprenylcysteine O-methyltransferase Ste14